MSSVRRQRNTTDRDRQQICPPMTLRVVLLRLELLLVVNASISEAHNFVDRHLSLQSVEDVLPPPVLHEVDALRTFSDQRLPP